MKLTRIKYPWGWRWKIRDERGRFVPLTKEMRRRIFTPRKFLEWYFSIYVVNAKGSGVGEKRGSWSFTVDAAVYTAAPIGRERAAGLEHLAETLAEWLVDEFGFHRATYTTEGSMFDDRRSAASAIAAGPWVCKLSVEDKVVAKGVYRPRSNIDAVNDCMLAEGMQRESYSLEGGALVPRVALKIRLCI